MTHDRSEALSQRSELTFSDLHRLLEAAAANLEKNKDIVNALNVFPVPDGDTGTNMLLTLRSTLEELQRSPPRSMREFTDTVTRGSLLGARGNSGVILSQLFRGCNRSLDSKERITVHDLAEAFSEASRTAYKAVMKPVEGTILTVAREASQAGMVAIGQPDIASFLAIVLQAAKLSLANTPHLLPILREAGVVDSGGQGLVFLLEGALAWLRGEEIQASQVGVQASFEHEQIFEEELHNRYDIQFLIRGATAGRAEMEKALQALGDSLLVIGGDGLFRVHVHSNYAAKILEVGSSFGTLDQLTMEDMVQQHQEFKERSKKGCNGGIGLASVSAGAGFEEIFTSLGVASIVVGGQSMNPSTKEILEAVGNTACNEWIILPNNSNVIGTAMQAKSMSNKKLAVIPTRSIPQGIAACLAYAEGATLEENVEAMERAIQRMHCGEVTYAVREGHFNGLDFAIGAVIGLVDGKLVKVGDDVTAVCLDLVHTMIKGTHPEVVLTLYRGEEVAEEDAEELCAQLSLEFPQAELEHHFGGQPFYFYIISLEE